MAPPRGDEIPRPVREPADGDLSAPRWAELSLRVPAQLADELLARFAERSLGAWTDSGEGAQVALRIYFGSSVAAHEAASEAGEAIERAGGDLRDYEVEVRDVRDERWVERYQAALRPFPFARSFVICPAGVAAPFENRTPIRLVPGRAFGTGEHPTTQLSAGLLESWVRPGEGWIDLGCGTGILALVALHRGARPVLAVDNDAEAVIVAREVIAANDAGDSVEVRCGSVSDLTRGWDGVVANILAPFFRDRSRGLARLVRHGGTLIASGFLSDEANEVTEAVERRGFEAVERQQRGEWCAAAFRRHDERR